jgi:ribonuclease HI
LCIEEEINSLIQKGAIQPAQRCPGFYSTLFLVTKNTGGWRPILNLKPLNKFIETPSFKMETVRSVLAGLERGMWTASIDLKDAYFHIPIHRSFRRFLRFAFQGRQWEFRVLPFGISTAPRVFTRVVLAITAYLRRRSIAVHTYIDDWLLKAHTRESLSASLEIVLKTLTDLGWMINFPKSELTPSQKFVYLGMFFDLETGYVYPTQERVQKLISLIQSVCDSRHVLARVYLRMLGLMVSLEPVIPQAALRRRPIQLFLMTQWTQSTGSLDSNVSVLAPLIHHLQWWLDTENLLVGVMLTPPHPQVTVYTDASMEGWGACLEESTISGLWNLEQSKEHINLLELRAVVLGLEHFLQKVQGKIVLIRSDNSTVVTYINRQGGTKSPSLCMMTWKLLCWCLDHQITLKAVHIPGRLNLLADSLSRRMSVLPTEWQLNQCVADRLFDHWGKPNIDLFATKKNAKMTTYVSPIPDPSAFATDALAISWGRMYAYAFPPAILIPKILQKIRQEECQVLLIAPDWPSRSWYTDLLDLLVCNPVPLPLMDDIIFQGKALHNNPSMFRLTAWMLSRNLELRRAFLSKQPCLWPKPGGGQPPEHIIIKSTDLQNGAQKDVLIQWIHLFK